MCMRDLSLEFSPKECIVDEGERAGERERGREEEQIKARLHTREERKIEIYRVEQNSAKNDCLSSFDTVKTNKIALI